MKEPGTGLALYVCLLLLFLAQDEVGKVDRSRAMQALWAMERGLVCILKPMGSLKGFKHRGQRVAVDNGESQASEGAGSLHSTPARHWNGDNGPNIARWSNPPKESGSTDFFF